VGNEFTQDPPRDEQAVVGERRHVEHLVLALRTIRNYTHNPLIRSVCDHALDPQRAPKTD